MEESLPAKRISGLFWLGLAVHILMICAVFDIYFSSPIDHGMIPIKSTESPPARRVVFIVADGLRAQAIYDPEHINNAPNLNDIRKMRGAWGISHTRVPTESRPGHVALLGGIYEDPSSILKGWKVNPVDFDSVINQSTNAWCWGGPSIINMFNKDNLSHIRLYSYDAKMEDFGNKNTTILDVWVFEEVERFINDQMYCNNCLDFHQDGNMFFLHLLGVDTAGHAFKPKSLEYNRNIQLVDQRIMEIEKMFEVAFPDLKTAFVFTSDHGMTEWGSHGAGSDYETKTPIIAWGAGIRPQDKQIDIEQIDTAPLLSALIGINYPINSLGKLPYAYLSSEDYTLNKMILSNVLQLREIFSIKQSRIFQRTFRFVPFPELVNIDAKIALLETLLNGNETEYFRTEAAKLMESLIKGIDYYHNYFQLPILISVTIGFVAWIIYLGSYIIETQIEPNHKILRRIEYFIYIPMISVVVIFVNMQQLPVKYNFYFMFPVLMVQMLIRKYHHVVEILRWVKSTDHKKSATSVLLYGLGLQALIMVFDNRRFLSVVLLLMSLNVFLVHGIRTRTTLHTKLAWVMTCLSLTIFPQFESMKTNFNLVLYLSGFLGWMYWFYHYARPIVVQNRTQHFIFTQLNFVAMTPFYTLAVEYNWIAADSVLKCFSGIWALAPVILIIFTPNHLYTRLISIFTGFGTFYLMVTHHYENLFLMCYTIALVMWIKTESRALHGSEQVENPLWPGDYRRAFYFVCFIFSGFFGTGNIASLNSFDPMWVRCFLTVFSPFKMTALILLRIAVPFIFACCAYRAINLMRRATMNRTFCIVLMYSDMILLELMYYITNIGSWLEIGISLSHFLVMEGFVLILLCIYGIAHLLVGNTTYKP